MPEFTIEPGLPIPQRNSALCKYPFAEMQPGDSFMVPTTEFLKVQSTLIANACNFKRSNYTLASAWKFQTRKVEGGVRIWRAV